MNFSKKQQAIIKDILSSTGTKRKRILGAAGTGKTLIIAHCSKELAKQGKKVLICYYNKTLQQRYIDLCFNGSHVRLDKFSGYICDKFGIETIMIAIALIVLGIVLYVVDKKAPSNVSYENMTFKQSFLIGLSQAIAAAFPGTSRSGITMTVARALGVDRESAAKYSFLLSTPIVLAAVLVSITDFEFTLAFFMGVLFSFLVGVFVIKFLLEYLKKGSFKVFAIYRVVLGVIVIAMTFMR